MIYTTYFAKLSCLPQNVIPISICAKAPEWYKGIQFKGLAPKYGFFSKWKQTHDNDYYIRHYYNEVLWGYDPHNLVKFLEAYRPDPTYHIALVCYEKPGNFCHRHLVAEWLRNHNIFCKEYEF